MNKGISNTIIDKERFVYVKLKVLPISKDSIMANLIFYNYSKNDFPLYKPLLPNDSPRLSIFIVTTQEDHENVDFIFPSDSSLKFYSGSYKTLPVLMPDFGTENFINLPKGGIIEFSMNIAKYYNFEEMLKKGKTKFEIYYLNLFPEILNFKPIMKKDSIDNELKPVYTTISLQKNDDDEFTKIKFTLKSK
jgi:hypothetical protein